jgi:hypothetical protein
MCCLISFGTDLFGHEQVVHQEITAKAAEAANNNSATFNGFIGLISSDGRSLQDAEQSMVDGSFDEDFADKDAGGKRSLNHFYDPLTGVCTT